MNKRQRFSLLLVLILLIGLLPVQALAADAPAELSATAEAENIQKYGNVVLSLTCEELKSAGYAYGDMLTVKFLDQTMDVPLCSNYSDVDSGSPGVFARASDKYVLLAINMGDFATTYGIAVKTTHEDKTFEWHYADGVTGPVAFTLSLKEAGGYYDEYVMHQLSRSDERAAYPGLTDEEFANFRPVATTGMGIGVLYRTSSPVNPELGRSAIADAALRRAGVTVVMNLADDEAAVKSYEGYAGSYYATTRYIALNMGVDFTAAEFKTKLAEGLRFFAENPGVYAVQCNEGKDRAGFVSALLECLMGASYDEVVIDYMTTFYNFYGVTPDEPRYETIANSNIVKTLRAAFGTDDLAGADLAACAEKYLKSVGLTDAQLAALKKNLSRRPALDLDALAKSARDTNFLTPQEHTGLNYDQIVYEHIDPEPLVEEAKELRTLCGDAKNLDEFKRRFLALADEFERLSAMYHIIQNRQYADSKDEWAAREVEAAAANNTLVLDAFNGLVRDALGSPCASALDGLLSEKAREFYLDYQDKSEEELALCARETALQSEYMSRIVDEYTLTRDGTVYTIDSVLEAYDKGELDYDTYWDIYVELSKMVNAAVGPVFVEMVGVRNRIAELNGYDSYAAYAYEMIYCRDYTPEDAQVFCDAVKRYILPKATAFNLLCRYPDQGNMPQDIDYDGEGMFETLFPYFAQLSDELLESARYTYEHGAYDVDPAPNKTGTAYSDVIPYYNMPFFFANASGGWYDLTSAIHELGHNNEAYWNTMNWNDAVLCYDTAEVHSQGLELLMERFYPELFGAEAEMTAAYTDNFMLSSIVEGCLYDEFQRLVYAEPDLTLTRVNQIYRQVCGEYGRTAADDPRTEMVSWYTVPHNFIMPMYFISYATSAAGAFAFWEASQADYFGAVDDYLRFTALGHEYGFVDSFLAVGMESPMTESYLKSLAQTLHDELLPVDPFTDVYADDWFGEGVIFVYDCALMNGVGDGLFAPNATATREQSMTVLARASDERTDAAAPYTVDEGVAWAVETGVSDGTERTAVLTREQFVTMLCRWVQTEGVDVSEGAELSGYADAGQISSWAADAMAWAVATGIVNGMDDGMLVPQGSLTRAQMATMLCRFANLFGGA